MASPERTVTDESRETYVPREWHERRFARPVKEGLLALLLVPLDAWVGMHMVFHGWVFFWLPLRSTANVMGRFSSPASRDWWLGSGRVSRRALARFVLRDLLFCSVLQAIALVLIRSWRTEVFEDIGLSAELGALPALGLLFLLQLSTRSALACVRHVGTCTALPSAVRATANGFRGGPAVTWALLQHGVVTALLAAPIVLGAVLARPGWFWGQAALLYPVLLFGMIASSEAVQSRLTASVRVSDLFRMPRLLPSRSARFAPRVGLLWEGSKRSVRVLAVLVVLGAVLSLALEESSSTVLPFVGLFAIILVLLSGFDSPFLWKSEGSQAAYLHAAGIDHALQRRTELLGGALMGAVAFGFVGWLHSTTGSVMGVPTKGERYEFLALLPMCSLMMLRSARGPVLGASTGRELAPVLFVAVYVLLAIAFGLGKILGVDWEGLRTGATPDALALAFCVLLALQTAAWTLGPLYLWWGAWRSTRDEGALKASIHG